MPATRRRGIVQHHIGKWAVNAQYRKSPTRDPSQGHRPDIYSDHKPVAKCRYSEHHQRDSIDPVRHRWNESVLIQNNRMYMAIPKLIQMPVIRSSECPFTFLFFSSFLNRIVCGITTARLRYQM